MYTKANVIVSLLLGVGLGMLCRPAYADTIALECQDIDNEFFAILPQEDSNLPILNFQDVEMPEESCFEAVERLNSLIAETTSPLSTMLLRTGTVGGEDVICAVFKFSSGCTNANRLATIPEAMTPEDFLDSLLTVEVTTFALGNPDDHTRRRIYAVLGPTLKKSVNQPGVHPIRQDLLNVL